MLRKNMKSLNVVRLQLQLRHIGLYKGIIDGFFGDMLHATVCQFQKENKLSIDGVVGPITQAAIERLTANAFMVLFLHTSASPEGRLTDNADSIILGHMLPNKENGRVIFMGQQTTLQAVIGKQIKLTGGKVYTITGREPSGRGWSRTGYSDIIEHDGRLTNIRDWNQDSMVNEWEMTFGILGSILLNNNARHICYLGGMSADMKQIKDTRNRSQLYTMESYIRFMLLRNPNIVIAGHDQVQPKACPCFDVPNYLRSLGIPEYNIANWGKLYV